ncbi:MAG TPA: PEP-CTERM sorting domain-containing protein [Pirellulaceae bacterium]|nr:PEP-CTERM sorting domain-containing protein [Pirellulaceae bacterium]
MKLLVRSFAMGLCACAMVLSSAARADVVVYSQLPDVVGGTAQNGFYSDAVSGQFYGQKIGDNFTLSQAEIITGIDWWGSSENWQFPDYTNFSSFTVEIFADNAGSVGTSITGPMVFNTAATNPQLVGNTLWGSDHFLQGVNITPTALGAGTYWISIGATAISPGDDAWAWTTSNGGDGTLAGNFFDANGWQTFNNIADFAFQIRAQDVVIPEPGTAALFSVLLVGLGSFVRRKRA